MGNSSEKMLSEKVEMPDGVAKSEQIEKSERILIKVNDLRDPRYRSFDLDKFLGVIARLRKEGLFKITREFEDHDYGKYMSVFASSESDHWADAVKKAQAIEITLTNQSKNFGVESRVGMTKVELKILMGKNEGRVFKFNFDKEGKYYNGGWDDVHLQKRLGPTGDEQDFALITEPDVDHKKLE